MSTKVSARVTLDTDHVSPDSLKAGFDCVVDRLLNHSDPVDWGTLQFALSNRGEETDLIVRAATL
jgi:hypothetical protein